MRRALLSFILVIAILATSRVTHAEFMTLNLSTDKISYNLGDTVNWTARFDIGGSTTANFGIATISMNLSDSQGNVLSPGVVNSSFPNGFAGYFRSGGTWDPASQQLIEIGASLAQNNFSVVGANNSQLTNITLAQGSFVATSSGNHTLIGSAGTTNNYFTSVDGINSSTLPSYSPINFVNATFTVTAVPEPRSIALMIVAGIGLAYARRRSLARRVRQEKSASKF